MRKHSKCILCRVLPFKHLYFNSKQGKDLTTKVNCVRHAKGKPLGLVRSTVSP
ncbi:MAG: hypothetical protein NZ455_15050 [Bacteroidia bacterium]|nr:hypothetical protein [Bacteroidia bacterium]